MRTSTIYTLVSLGLLEQLVFSSPLDPSINGITLGNGIRPRDDSLWPPELPDWPFAANKSEVENMEPKPEHIPPTATVLEKDGDVHARNELSKAFMHKSCDDTELQGIILAAWEEAKQLSRAQTSFHIGYPYNIPHTQWLGKDWNSESSWYPWRKNFRKRIQNNFGRVMNVFSDNAPKHDYLYFYCHDWANECNKPEVKAYATTYGGLFWDNHYIAFCAGFWNTKLLKDLLEENKNNPHNQKVMENFEGSQGGILYHEMWHLPMVSDPKTTDYAYTAQPNWKLAEEEGTWWSSENADSYHLDAVAIYVHQHYKSSMSPVPRSQLKDLDPSAYAATEEPVKNPFETKYIPWIGAKPAEADSMPNINDWTEVTSKIWKNTTPENSDPEPAEPRALKCLQREWGAPKESTDDGSTPVKTAIHEFCKKRNGQMVENRGDHIYDRWDVSGLGITKRESLWLSATTGPFDQCGRGTIEEKDCITVLTGAMKGCDKDQPMTFGAIAQGEGCIEYAIEVSTSIHEGDPPWNQHVKSFPPPEVIRSDLAPASLIDSQIVCSKERGANWSPDDADAAIKEYSDNDYAWSDGYEPMSVRGNVKIAASWTNGLEAKRGYNGPYKLEDKGYCNDFDTTKKSQDDCNYAFRKIIQQKLNNHAFCITYYRCVGYMVVGGEFSDPLDVEKAGLTESDNNGPVRGNLTTGNGYVADIIAKLGVQSFE